VGLGATLKLYSGPRFVTWLIGGFTAGLLVVVLF